MVNIGLETVYVYEICMHDTDSYASGRASISSYIAGYGYDYIVSRCQTIYI